MSGGGRAASSSSSGKEGNGVPGGEDGGTGNSVYFDFFSIRSDAEDIIVGKSRVFSRGQSRYASKTVERMHTKFGGIRRKQPEAVDRKMKRYMQVDMANGSICGDRLHEV